MALHLNLKINANFVLFSPLLSKLIISNNLRKKSAGMGAAPKISSLTYSTHKYPVGIAKLVRPTDRIGSFIFELKYLLMQLSGLLFALLWFMT